MDIELTPDLCLSHQTVKKIIKKKTEHLGNLVDLENLRPNLNFIKPSSGKRGIYATIEFTSDHPVVQDSIHRLSVFLKIRVMKNINNQFNIVKTVGLFYREIEVYSYVFTKILKSNDEDIVPKFFHAEKDIILVIEDMISKNYKTINKMRALDLSHCKVVLKSLARFHARTIIYQEMVTAYPLLGYSKQYSPTEKITISQPESYLRVHFRGIGQKLADDFYLMRELQNLDYKKFKHDFIEMVGNFFDKIAHLSFSKLRVLCHSDLVASNLLFRYNDNNEPLTCCFVDFQFTKYSSPAYDVWGFLYMNTTEEMRNAKLDDFFQIYYDSLSEVLNENEIDASYIFPYTEFIAMMEKDRIYGLTQGILNLYEELRQDLKSKYGKEYREMLAKLWTDSTELSSENVKKYRDYKKRIMEEIIELHSLLMTTS